MIRIPRGTRGLNKESGIINAPRVMQKVKGDFVGEVSVSTDVVLKESTFPGKPISGSAGLVLWANNENFLRLERAKYRNKQQQEAHRCIFKPHRKDRLQRGDLSATANIDPWRLRMTRQGPTFIGEYSEGDNNWRTAGQVDVSDLLDELMIGVSVSSTSTGVISARFDSFRLEKLDKQSD